MHGPIIRQPNTADARPLYIDDQSSPRRIVGNVLIVLDVNRFDARLRLTWRPVERHVAMLVEDQGHLHFRTYHTSSYPEIFAPTLDDAHRPLTAIIAVRTSTRPGPFAWTAHPRSRTPPMRRRADPLGIRREAAAHMRTHQ